MSPTEVLAIEEWKPDHEHAATFEPDVEALADVLRAVVYDGAGVSFIVPFSIDDARAFWLTGVVPDVKARTRRVLIARLERLIVGTVQIDLATPPNQRHRADVLKLLVHPDARRRGIARALMVAVEPLALTEGRTLLTLDTWTGRAAETLYRSLGYTAAGVIPGYARASLTPELEPTTIMYKVLTSGFAGVEGSLSR
jgi:GNAT superfamily N-acetyltransferase